MVRPAFSSVAEGRRSWRVRKRAKKGVVCLVILCSRRGRVYALEGPLTGDSGPEKEENGVFFLKIVEV